MQKQTGIFLIDQVINEFTEFVIHLTRTYIGFLLGNIFVNYHSFMNWIFFIAALDFICIHVATHVLENYFPENLHFLLKGRFIAQLFSLGFISLIMQQPLILLLFSRALFYLFSLYSTIFATLPLESIAIAYYLNSVWYVVPVFINICISIAYLLDMFMGVKFWMWILELPFIKRIFNELGIRIDLMYPKPQEELERSIKAEEEYAVQYLKKSLKGLYIGKSIDLFKTYLKENFEKTIEKVKDDKGNLCLLAVDVHESLKPFNVFKKQRILNLYYQNTFHTLWRMMCKENDLLAKDDESGRSHQLLQDNFYQQWIVLNWILAKQKQKELYFLEELAKIYRGRNYQATQIKFFMNEMNSFGMDRPHDFGEFRNFLSRFSDENEDMNLLTIEKIDLLLEEYVRNIWNNKISQLDSKQFKKLKTEWDSAHGKIKDLSFFNISEFEIDGFLKKMEEDYQERWTTQDYYTKYVKNFFDVEIYFINHAHKFSSLFQFKVMDKQSLSMAV